jgi:hypothetical protein
MRQRLAGVRVLPTVRKRIRGDIDDAHDLRATQVDLKTGGVPGEHGAER